MLRDDCGGGLGMRHIRFWIAALILITVPRITLGIDVLMVGEFRPDMLNPATNRFDFSKTQYVHGGVCGNLTAGNECFRKQYAEVVFPLVAGGNIIPANPSRGFKLAASGRWHTVDIVSSDGAVNTVQARVAGIYASISAYEPGGNYSWIPFVPGGAPDEKTAFEYIFGHSKDYMGSCSNSNTWSLPTRYYSVLLYTAAGDVNCVATNKYDISVAYGARVARSSFLVEVLAPNPLSMESGEYVGNLGLQVGEGGDVDFGVTVPADMVNLRLKLSVLHDFGVRFPGGSNLLSLVPEGGWMAWLQRGRKPTRLFRDQKFDIQTSTPFSMKVTCEFPVGASCAIQNGLGHKVALDVSVTMPPGFRDSANQPVSRYPLTSTASLFKPDGYQVKKATMHFEVPKTDMETMLDHAGTRYSGTVTIIFEPEL